MKGPISPVIPPDAELILGVRRGEVEAFEILFNRYRRYVEKIGLRITKNEADAEDVVQNTFFNVYRFAGTFDGNAKFTTWLHRIAVNHSLMIIRGRERYSRHELSLPDDALKLMPGRVRSPESTASTIEMARKMYRRICFLGKKNRKAFILQVLGGLSAKEQADLEGCGTSVIKSRVLRAKLNLRSFIAGP